jgi:hypothetical protein
MIENLNCKIVADSINLENCRLTTILFKRFPYCLIQEPATHRLNVSSAISPFFLDQSRNSASTRAIPLKKLIEQVRNDPFVPTFQLNKRGMSGSEITNGDFLERQKLDWLDAMHLAIKQVEMYEERGIHKSKPSKLLIPWLRIPILISSTNWDGFFKLRCADDVDVDLLYQTQDAKRMYDKSQPRLLKLGEWHIPLEAKSDNPNHSHLHILKASAANVARLSYMNHENKIDFEGNLNLAESLIENGHMSPFEHIACNEETDQRYRNFGGFSQLRMYVENKYVREF